MKSFIARHETAAFVALTFGIAWPLWTLATVVLGIWLFVYFGREANRIVPWPGARPQASRVAAWTLGAAAGSAALFVLAWLMTAGVRARSMPPLAYLIS